jgi:hypothetical protein
MSMARIAAKLVTVTTKRAMVPLALRNATCSSHATVYTLMRQMKA